MYQLMSTASEIGVRCSLSGGQSGYYVRTVFQPHVEARFLDVQAQDSENEDFNDDQMFQMDDKIAAALKVLARGGANARESREAIQNFKFRVIGLIEVFIKKVGFHAPLC